MAGKGRKFEGTDQVDQCMFCGNMCVDQGIDLATTPTKRTYAHLGGKVGKSAVCEGCLGELAGLLEPKPAAKKGK